MKFNSKQIIDNKDRYRCKLSDIMHELLTRSLQLMLVRVVEEIWPSQTDMTCILVTETLPINNYDKGEYGYLYGYGNVVVTCHDQYPILIHAQ